MLRLYALARPDCTCTARSECSITRRNTPMLASFRSLVSHHPTQEKVKTDSHASVMPLGRMTRISQVLGWRAIITGGVGSFVGEPFDHESHGSCHTMEFHGSCHAMEFHRSCHTMEAAVVSCLYVLVHFSRWMGFRT
jgi:hypothetical protein